MRVLIACEESQEVCKAFRAKGHEAYSCDILPCYGGHPEWHINEDVLQFLNPPFEFWTQNGDEHEVEKWDLIIAHPPCTYLSNAGARFLFGGGRLNEERYKKGLEAKEFFMKFYNADCPKICVENPISSKIYKMPPFSQEIQPYHFGEEYGKRTRLWLKGLPPLFATELVKTDKTWVASNTSKNKGTDRNKYAAKSAKARSKTFAGIAKAMAEQWG